MEMRIFAYMKSLTGYVQVVEAVDDYTVFVNDVNSVISAAFDQGIGVRDIKYTVTEARAGIFYSAMILFDNQKIEDTE